MSRVLICGTRDWQGTWEQIADHFPYELDLTIIHGACSRVVGGMQRSVDMIVEFAARGLGIPTLPFPVDHALDGPWPSAGPRRNARMLREGKPDRGMAFGPLWKLDVKEDRVLGVTGGRWKHTGTGGMVSLMLAAGLPVRWIAAPGAFAVDLVTMPEPPAGGGT